MNQTPYGLTAGLHSLDEREQNQWLERIKAGNCYINRTITGAIVERQPFGGCKESSFGKGSKAGGPNYLVQLMHPTQIKLPAEKGQPHAKVLTLAKLLPPLSKQDLNIWQASIDSYAYHWEFYFSRVHDRSLIRGQDNYLKYVPHGLVVLRMQKGDMIVDLFRLIAAALTCGTPVEVSVEEEKLNFVNLVPIRHETNEAFAQRISKDKIKRVRMLQTPPSLVLEALAQNGCHLHCAEVLANGRLELLHLLREVAISRDYHRYGNLEAREKEKRRPLPGLPKKSQVQHE